MNIDAETAERLEEQRRMRERNRRDSWRNRHRDDSWSLGDDA